jgi:hypothetical protein
VVLRLVVKGQRMARVLVGLSEVDDTRCFNYNIIVDDWFPGIFVVQIFLIYVFLVVAIGSVGARVWQFLRISKFFRILIDQERFGHTSSDSGRNRPPNGP